MPRKKKSETVEVTEVKEEKPKATRKRKSTKKVEPAPVTPAPLEFSISEILTWTDEECSEKDKVFKFTTADVRDILKSLTSSNEKLKEVTEKFNLLKNAISKGLMIGYKVECPHCKREYLMSSAELHRDKPILCKVCGTEYKENEHITGISYASDEEKVTVI